MLFYFFLIRKSFFIKKQNKKKIKETFRKKSHIWGESKKMQEMCYTQKAEASKTEHSPPISSVYQKTKIYPSIYIYHHIITQPIESHFADHTPPPRLAITTRHTDMNNLFVTFFCLVNSLI